MRILLTSARLKTDCKLVGLEEIDDIQRDDKGRTLRREKAASEGIGRPVKESGLSLEEVIRTLIQKEEIQVQRKLAIVGIGMGNRETGGNISGKERHHDCREPALFCDQ